MKSYTYKCHTTAPAAHHQTRTRCIEGQQYQVRKVRTEPGLVEVTGLFMDQFGAQEFMRRIWLTVGEVAPYMALDSEFVRNIYPRFVLGMDGKPQLYSLYDENKDKKPGDRIRHDVAAPGMGYIEYQVVAVTPYGVYGTVVRNTVRIMDISDCI